MVAHQAVPSPQLHREEVSRTQDVPVRFQKLGPRPLPFPLRGWFQPYLLQDLCDCSSSVNRRRFFPFSSFKILTSSRRQSTTSSCCWLIHPAKDTSISFITFTGEAWPFRNTEHDSKSLSSPSPNSLEISVFCCNRISGHYGVSGILFFDSALFWLSPCTKHRRSMQRLPTLSDSPKRLLKNQPFPKEPGSLPPRRRCTSRKRQKRHRHHSRIETPGGQFCPEPQREGRLKTHPSPARRDR
jgi:hypothetical protein